MPPRVLFGAGQLNHLHDFFAKKAAKEPVIKMVKAMGAENPVSGKDFIKVLDELIAIVGCTDLKMSDIPTTRKELKLYSQKIHEVLGGDIGGMQEVLPQLSPSTASMSSEGTPGNGEKRKKVYDKVRRAAEILQKKICRHHLSGNPEWRVPKSISVWDEGERCRVDY